MPTKAQPPAEIELIYQKPDGRHVFTATGISGFYYSSTSLDKTYKEVAVALSLHISRLYGIKANYKLDRELPEFKRLLDCNEDDADYTDVLLKNVVIATKSPRLASNVNK